MPDVQFLIFFGFYQVHDLFIVQFEIWTGDQTFCIFHSVDPGKEFIEGLLHESIILPYHCMSLAWSGLSIDKNTRVVSIKNIVEKFVSNKMENVFLSGLRCENFVEGKLMCGQFYLCLTVGKNGLLFWCGFDPNKDLNGVLAGIWVHLLLTIKLGLWAFFLWKRKVVYLISIWGSKITNLNLILACLF